MATPATVSELVSSVRQSLAFASEAVPKLVTMTPPEDGLSLLDVKNELLLSYLEHVVFLVLLKLHGVAASKIADGGADLSLGGSTLGQSTVKKLVELRLYLEKGVHPLEEKLRYQIEKALRVAEDVERQKAAKQAVGAEMSESGASGASGASDSDSASDDDDSDESDDAGEVGGEMGDFDDEEENTAVASRPNRAAFVRPAAAVAGAAVPKTGTGRSGDVYRPPRIAPTMMPTETTVSGRRGRAERRPLKSATMDEFIADELSTAPRAELSIGTNIAGRGRHMKTDTERQREDERRAYEERNFVRLPKEGKKERAKRARVEGGGGSGGRMAFGGEEWHGLSEGVDRINRLTHRKSGGGGGGSVRGMLDKSRKRGIDTVDGPRASGRGADTAVGAQFRKKLRTHKKNR